jgi:hypothetical protein
MTNFDGSLYLFLPLGGPIPAEVLQTGAVVFRPLDFGRAQYEVCELGRDEGQVWRVYGAAEARRRWPGAGLL